MTIAGNSLRCKFLSHLESLLGHSRLLQIGGGLLAGAATIHAGYHAWDENKEGRTEEEVGFYHILILTFPCLPSSKKQALTWGLQRWQRDAYVRTEEFHNHGPRAPTTWVLVDGRDKIPKSAIEAGKDKDGHPIYFARVYYEDSIGTFGRLASFPCLCFIPIPLFRNWQSFSLVQGRFSRWIL
jgi:hypothetical protein